MPASNVPGPLRLLAAALFFCAPALTAAEPAPPSTADAIPDTAIVVQGEPYLGTLLLPATDAGFRFRLKDTGDVVEFRWKSLEPPERARIQKLMGITTDEQGAVKVVPDVDGIRLKLKTGRVVEGLDRPKDSRPGFRALKTKDRLVQIPQPDIESEEALKLPASAVYSAEEIYQNLMLEKPPESASDHLAMARTCADLGMWEKSIDHLDMAGTIDARVNERMQDFRDEAVAKYREVLADELYDKFLTYVRGEQYALAIDVAERIKRNFPGSPRYTDIDHHMIGLEKKAAESQNKQVVLLYYQFFNELIQRKIGERKRIDDKGRPVPKVPGKQVTAKGGRVFRGTVASDAEDKIVLEWEGQTTEIPRKEILLVQDVDLSKAHKEIPLTFTELKAYVENVDGLGKDIVARIAVVMKLEDKKVKDLWDSRFNATAKVVGGQLIKTPALASLHEATFGKGSWLRDGSTWQSQGAQNGPNSGQNAAQNRLRQEARRLRSEQQGGSTPQVGGMVYEEEQTNPEDSEEPDVWFAAQRTDVKFNILKASSAEKLFRVKQVVTTKQAEFRGEVNYKILYE